MSKVCLGCGVKLQSLNKDESGFIPKEKILDGVYCERCFRLKHYHEMRMDDLALSNEEILLKAKKYNYPIYYFLDVFNLSNESLKWFERLNHQKILVLTKVDLLPRSINIARLIERIKDVYSISSLVLTFSVKDQKKIRELYNHIERQGSPVLFLGMTNVGKSSCLNELSKHSLSEEVMALISEMPNTTREFLVWDFKEIKIIDAPGFNYKDDYRDKSWALKITPKKYLRPITMPMKKETYLLFEDLFYLNQNLEQNSITFMGSNDLVLEKKYQVRKDYSWKTEIHIPENHDLVIPGLVFFHLKKETIIYVHSKDTFNYEVRNSIFGGYNDTN